MLNLAPEGPHLGPARCCFSPPKVGIEPILHRVFIPAAVPSPWAADGDRLQTGLSVTAVPEQRYDRRHKRWHGDDPGTSAIQFVYMMYEINSILATTTVPEVWLQLGAIAGQTLLTPVAGSSTCLRPSLSDNLMALVLFP